MALTYNVYERTWGYDACGDITGWSNNELIKTFDSEEEAVEFIRSIALEDDGDPIYPHDSIETHRIEDRWGNEDVTYCHYEIEGYDEEDEES